MQAKYKLVRAQLYAMWSYVGHKGENVEEHMIKVVVPDIDNTN
jgi:hypothetical protein